MSVFKRLSIWNQYYICIKSKGKGKITHTCKTMTRIIYEILWGTTRTPPQQPGSSEWWQLTAEAKGLSENCLQPGAAAGFRSKGEREILASETSPKMSRVSCICTLLQHLPHSLGCSAVFKAPQEVPCISKSVS